jgi:hypothetical protein
MKKLFTLFIGLLAFSAMFAQDAPFHPARQYRHNSKSHVPTHGLRLTQSSSRAGASCDTLQLYYSSYYEVWASNLGLTFNGSLTSGDPLNANEVTPFVDTVHAFNDAWVKSVFDTLAYVDANNALAFLPRATTTIKLDSLGMEIGISGDSTKMHNDSLVFTIYKRVGLVETAVKTVVMSGPSWFEEFYTDPGFLGYAQVGIDYQFNKGEGFAVRMDYLAKDTSSHCLFAYTYADSCGTIPLGGQNFASPAYTPPFGRISFSGEITPNGGTATVALSNNTQAYNIPGVPLTCRYVYEQVYDFFPIISACVDYGATIIPAQPAACPQSTVALSSAVFGTNSQNISYSWAAVNGTITANGNSTTSVVMGDSSTVTVYLTVDDGTNVAYDTVVLLNKGIHVTFASPTFNLTCGSRSTLIPVTSGNQAGISYTWNIGSGNSTISIDSALTYSVTVTNNFGCSASASVAASYPNVSNTVNFTTPAPPLCKNTQVAFTNTSTHQTGWNTTWDMTGTGTDVYGTPNVTFSYASAGNYNVKLVMDSAGCEFAYSRNVSIANCTGIEDLEFGKSISLQPNPSNGNFNVTINGIEKNLSIKVYNIIGSEVKTFTTNDVASTFSKSFDFSDLSYGTYLMKIQSADKTAVKKFTINK